MVKQRQLRSQALADWTIPERRAEVACLYFLAESPDGCLETGELKAKILKSCFPEQNENAQWNIVSNKDKPGNLIHKGLVAFDVESNGRWEDFSGAERLRKGDKRPKRLRITNRGRLVVNALRQRTKPTGNTWFCSLSVPDDSEIAEIESSGEGLHGNSSAAIATSGPINQLESHLSQFTSAPFLFVGSGFSRRYLGLPTWEELLRLFANGLPRPFEFYKSTAEGDLPKTASLIAEDFHELWWADPKHVQSRSRFSSMAINRTSALKFEIASYLESNAALPPNEESREELPLLSRAVIDGIITTNWDPLLEKLFDQYKVFVGQNELLFGATQGIGEIYKIHGSLKEPNSIVLTAEDYEAFNQRNPYLAAKLLTIFVDHPVIFLGYSLSDPNITETLDLIVSSLTPENVDRLHQRLIVVTYEPGLADPVLSQSTIAVQKLLLPVLQFRTSSFTPVFQALSKFKRKFPVRLLRQLKEHVYELVLKDDPWDRLFVQDIENSASVFDLDVVLGVGAKHVLAEQGYKRLDRFDLVQDLLFDNRHLDPARGNRRATSRPRKANALSTHF